MPRLEDIKVARVLHEDDEFVTLEVMKKDTSTFRVGPVPGEENPQTQKFLTLLFVKADPDERNSFEVWDPFA